MDINLLKSNLISKGYSFSFFENAVEAAAYLDSQIDGKTIGAGGSVTLEQLGIYEKLSSHNTFFWQQRTPVDKTNAEMRVLCMNTQIYLTSANGISMSGEIVNIDGTCNRVSSMLYGHEKVYFIIGRNKIADDLESAIYRSRNIAAPLNAQRLKRNTPCAVNADKCYDCSSPDRICNAFSVLWKKPGCCEYEVILINEDLGY